MHLLLSQIHITKIYMNYLLFDKRYKIVYLQIHSIVAGNNWILALTTDDIYAPSLKIKRAAYGYNGTWLTLPGDQKVIDIEFYKDLYDLFVTPT